MDLTNTNITIMKYVRIHISNIELYQLCKNIVESTEYNSSNKSASHYSYMLICDNLFRKIKKDT